MNNLDKHRADLKQLLGRAQQLETDLTAAHNNPDGTTKHVSGKKQITVPNGALFREGYQGWYTEAQGVIHQILPKRFDEFCELYTGGPRRKTLDISTYAIRDWLLGLRAADSHNGGKLFDDTGAALGRFVAQSSILTSAEKRFESSLFEIRQLVQADLFDSELQAATELSRGGFLRAAAAVAGVIIEAHLADVANAHQVKITKKDPGVSHLNDALKNAGVIDIPLWRSIQRLGDLRNLCDHKKARDPTPDEITELIAGADRLIKIVS